MDADIWNSLAKELTSVSFCWTFHLFLSQQNKSRSSWVVLFFKQDSDLWLRERVQIGRLDEVAGQWASSMHCDVGGRPLLRHRVELGEGTVAHDGLSAPMSMSARTRSPW